MQLTFYDHTGTAIAYLDDDEESIYLYDGTPVAWLSVDSVYAYSGKHLGWFIDGWIHDHRGDCVFFTKIASSGPIKPVKGIQPVQGIRRIRPVRGIREIKPVKPVRSLNWSSLSGKNFFYQ